MSADSWSSIRRPTEDRMLAGVCAAAARQLGIDPVIVRVVIAVLALVGPAGWILYAAGWLLIPSEGEDHGPLARAFGVDQHERQLMIVGFIVAAFLAGGWLIGTPFRWDTGFFWWAPWVILAAIVWVVTIRRRSTRNSAETMPAAAMTSDGASGPASSSGNAEPPAGTESATQAAAPPTAPTTTPTKEPPARPHTPHSPALAAITALGVMIAMSATWLWDEIYQPVPASGYLLIALLVVTLGVLTGAWVGDAGLIIGAGVVLSIALAVSLIPTMRTGDIHYEPDSATSIASTYDNGVGRLTLDLTSVAEPDELIGRTITLRQSIGETRVLVPENVPTHAEGNVTVGSTELFGAQMSGTQISSTQQTADSPALTLKIHQTIGSIEVIRK